MKVYLIWDTATNDYITMPSGKSSWGSKGAAKNATYNDHDYPTRLNSRGYKETIPFNEQTKYECHEVEVIALQSTVKKV